MSMDSMADADRWEEMQIARLLFGLSADEQAEYDELARQMPADHPEPFDRVVAGLDVAWTDLQPQPLPEHLRETIRVRAEQELTSRHSRRTNVVSVASSPVGSSVNYVPWLVAAACLAISLLTWFSQRPVKKALPLVAQRRALMASAVDLVQADWSEGLTPIAGATGDIVWSSDVQRGFMRFRGLPANVSTVEQYQLWIFDKNQSDATPIDGGVFDVRTDGEVIVPIHAKLRVQDAVMFAVTIEKPGGVVVSSRKQLPLLAKVR